MRLVLDTNLLVSALLKPGSVPDRLLELVWGGAATALYDTRMTDEYRSVLARSKFRSIDRARIDEVFARLLARGEEIAVAAEWKGAMKDEGDRMFVEIALAGRAHAIVTGNLKDYPRDQGFDVLPPATALAMLS